MRLIVIFDLPVETSDNRREYTKFHKYLIKHGFVMAQKSVYSKIALNRAAMEVIKSDVREHAPPEGNVQMLSISELQFQNIEVIVGEAQKTVLDTLDRFVII